MYPVNLTTQDLLQRIQFAKEHKNGIFATKEAIFEHMIKNDMFSMSFCIDGAHPNDYGLVTKELFNELFELGENAKPVTKLERWERVYHAIEYNGTTFHIISDKSFLSMDWQRYVEIKMAVIWWNIP